jgi:ceramide glucosyltransferase
MLQNTDVPARLIVGEVDAGPNPKVNNLLRGYATANYDLILISDSNVRVDSMYLRRCTELMTPDVGIVTAAVTGLDPHGFGGRLESMYLNTFYARWMVAAGHFGFPTVIGKSMLFSKNTAARFGGMRNLSSYLAEDYMAGQAMRHLGLEIKVMNDPVPQVIGYSTFGAFWQRHVRWGRMRKNMLLFSFMGEFFSGAAGSALILAAAFWTLTGSFHPLLLAFHFAFWFLCDFLLMTRLSTQVTVTLPFYWFVREVLSIPMWLHVMSGNTVLWRGRRLRLEAGGVLSKSVQNGGTA